MTARLLSCDTAESLDDDEAVTAYADLVLGEGEGADLRRAFDPVARRLSSALLARMAEIGGKATFGALRTQGEASEEVFRAALVAANPCLKFEAARRRRIADAVNSAFVQRPEISCLKP